MHEHAALFDRLPLPGMLELVIPYSLLVILVLGGLAIAGTRDLKRVPGKLQNFLELVVEGLEGLVTTALGPGGKRFVPFIGSIFLFILGMNYLGLFPGMKAPTTNLNATVSMALVAIFFVHFHAIRAHGVGGWLRHFAGDPVFLAPLMFPLHVVGELARVFSLSLRLFGNIFGEETVVAILAGMSPFLFQWGSSHWGIAVPFQLPMLLFAMFGGLIQALVFTILTCIYISVTVGDLDEHGHGHAHHGAEAAVSHGTEPDLAPAH